MVCDHVQLVWKWTVKSLGLKGQEQELFPYTAPRSLSLLKLIYDKRQPLRGALKGFTYQPDLLRGFLVSIQLFYLIFSLLLQPPCPFGLPLPFLCSEHNYETSVSFFLLAAAGLSLALVSVISSLPLLLWDPEKERANTTRIHVNWSELSCYFLHVHVVQMLQIHAPNNLLIPINRRKRVEEDHTHLPDHSAGTLLSLVW